MWPYEYMNMSLRRASLNDKWHVRAYWMDKYRQTPDDLNSSNEENYNKKIKENSYGKYLQNKKQKKETNLIYKNKR